MSKFLFLLHAVVNAAVPVWYLMIKSWEMRVEGWLPTLACQVWVMEMKLSGFYEGGYFFFSACICKCARFSIATLWSRPFCLVVMNWSGMWDTGSIYLHIPLVKNCVFEDIFLALRCSKESFYIGLIGLASTRFLLLLVGLFVFVWRHCRVKGSLATKVASSLIWDFLSADF